jgi:hypothetical protein
MHRCKANTWGVTIEALRPAVSSSLYSRAPKSGVTMKEKESLAGGSLGAILRLNGSEVSFLASKGNAPLSCWLPWEEHSAVHLGCSVSGQALTAQPPNE